MMCEKAEMIIEKLGYYNLQCGVRKYSITEKCQRNITYNLNTLIAELDDDILIFDDLKNTLLKNSYVLCAIDINLLEDVLFSSNKVELLFKNKPGYISINAIV